MSVNITRWSTPAITAEIPGEVPLENISEISVKIKMGVDKSLEKLYTKGEVVLDDKTIIVPITQEETSTLKGSPLLQVNLYFSDGTRLVSQQEHISVFDNLKQEAMG